MRGVCQLNRSNPWSRFADTPVISYVFTAGPPNNSDEMGSVSRALLPHDRQLPPIRRVARAAERLAHGPRGPFPADIPDPQRACAVLGVEPIEGAHEPRLAGAIPRVEEVGLDLCHRRQVEQHHAAFLVGLGVAKGEILAKLL